MIYLAKNQENYVISDSFTDYVPTSFDIYLDNDLIGSFANISTNTVYYTINIPSESIDGFQEKEYKLKWVDNGATIKQELCMIRNFADIEVKTATKTKTLKMYE
jgi:hypothetical protein